MIDASDNNPPEDGLPEPPPAEGPGLFGEPVAASPAPAAKASTPASPGKPYRVLARAYRPTRFDDLIGQDAMVRILRRAFELGRVAHAFMLTGVRGVGKTTSARIIARALNCVGPDGSGGPTADPCGVCANCTAILADRHPDVLEMDAASRTGIEDVREIIEATRFRPMQARMKVFIIDEVHMLSRNAFNALLKTLEEPPSQVTFIFATTELRKVPVTVLSRCQRFDLRRVSIGELSAHFARIAAREGAALSADALALIARAADGSVRDGLSLLDQAIAQGPADGGPEIGAEQVADMLGLADRGLVFDLLEAVMAGRADSALAITDQAHARGADLGQMLQDLLELIHTVSRLKSIPALRAGNDLPEAERVRGAALADALSVPVLGRAWQMLLKGVGEIETAPDRREAAEMVLIRLCHVADMPTPAELVRQIQAEGTGALVARTPPLMPGGRADGAGGLAGGAEAGLPRGVGLSADPLRADTRPADALRPAAPTLSGSLHVVSGGGAALRAPEPQLPEPASMPAPMPAQDRTPDPGLSETASAAEAPPSLRSWREVVAFVNSQRLATLHGNLMHCAHLVRFRPPVIELSLEPGAPPRLSQQLASVLQEATGARWSIVIVRDEPGEPTLAQQAGLVQADLDREAENHPLVRAILTAFPGAVVGPVSDRSLDEYYALPPEQSESLLAEDGPPDMEFAPEGAESVGLDDLSDG
ncbi:DNA polymerase III subunit gamma/tau [Acetobacteraceae bacterium KSS8]|uniref:DNA polymerase III subunit gamma/tau n=1 Tax=Endosaccharibacter trunci TaxID=2812733 RepID=A0ABT1W217_9PROT|nr:DNA polymerase III subunit gamma/tau [Acetobacteraceae bacterium KSS8]